MSHPVHPKCHECGKALYKSPKKGDKVSKDSPWAYCRNANCGLHVQGTKPATNVNEALATLTLPPIVDSKKVTVGTSEAEPASGRRIRRKMRRRTEPAKGGPPSEPADVTAIRLRIHTLVDLVCQGKNQHAMMLVLVLLNQEMGQRAAAKVIIEQYGLGKMFSLQH